MSKVVFYVSDKQAVARAPTSPKQAIFLHFVTYTHSIV